MIDGRRPLSMAEKAFLKAMKPLATFSEGFWIDFGEEIVRAHGISGFFKWAKITGDIQAELQAEVGVMHNHLLSAFSSLLNGCDYCGFGNLLAFNMHWLKERGELFPIPEFDGLRLLKFSYEELYDEVAKLLEGEQYEHERRLVLRQMDLKLGRVQVETDEDRVLQRSLHLYDFINECSIVVDAPAPPLGHISKEKGLLQKYREMRPLPERFTQSDT